MVRNSINMQGKELSQAFRHRLVIKDMLCDYHFISDICFNLEQLPGIFSILMTALLFLPWCSANHEFWKILGINKFFRIMDLLYNGC